MSLIKTNKKDVISSIITYRLSGLSRQVVSIPGNDIMVSARRCELGFWLL